MPLLEVDEVSVRFGGQMALDGVTVTAEVGRVTGLIGPNGAGKTTLFNVVTGLLAPTRGRVRLDGVEIGDAAPHERARRGMARTFQRLELFGSLTAQENLEVAAEIRRGPNSTAAPPDERVAETIELVGMRGFADTRADRLTTGQARLVELARALVTSPRLLLLDEPASGLDTDETESLARLLGVLARSGIGLVLVEHDISLVMDVCDHVHVLDFGRVIASGAPADVQQDPAVREAYLGRATEDVS